jgi:hypothetical protein
LATCSNSANIKLCKHQALQTSEQLSELEPLLAFFASFVLGRRLMEQLARWDMIILEEFPRIKRFLGKKFWSANYAAPGTSSCLRFPSPSRRFESWRTWESRLPNFSSEIDLVVWLNN